MIQFDWCESHEFGYDRNTFLVDKMINYWDSPNETGDSPNVCQVNLTIERNRDLFLVDKMINYWASPKEYRKFLKAVQCEPHKSKEQRSFPVDEW